MNDRSSPAVDQGQRDRALNVRQSFIVRAPAGSGKTRLLIQRYLALLACVDEPEEIIAITFTRKAAAEMRARVLRAFASANAAANLVATDTLAVDDETRRLAKTALAHDTSRGWHIVANPSRLRIQTIDSMNASITRQMPLTSRFGAQPESVEDANALYVDAARNVLAQVNAGNSVAEDVAILLAHLDNSLSTAEILLADMLRSRDHWLRNLPFMQERDVLEAGLARVRATTVSRMAALFPEGEMDETLELARFAGGNRPADGADAGVWLADSSTTFPSVDEDDLPAWLGIANLLVTKEGSWRKRRGLNKNTGFPTGSNKAEKEILNAWKNRMGDLLDRLAQDHVGGERLLAAFGQLRLLPPARYSESQWTVLGAIVRLLPYATAELWSLFGARGQCDFTEIAQAASRALGEECAPTDLALALDYRIRHLLIDEFQDTSIAQFELLEKLTRGWVDEDGRTLFAVGDPMQSIYRFREAEVGLFMSAARAGIGCVSLQPLTLQVNFRSQRGIVDWVNATFGEIMPSKENAGPDEVPYATSVTRVALAECTPSDAEAGMNAVTWHVQFKQKRPAATGTDATLADDEAVDPSTGEVEAKQVIEIILDRQEAEPDAEIAVLVRNRAHLREIVPALKAADISFRAVDIDPLKERPVVVDLLALTRAILHLADRIAWLAVLRAPWCGLTLNDMAALTGGAIPKDGVLDPDDRTVWQLLCDEARMMTLSIDGQARAANFCATFAPALRLRRRMPLRDLLESVWLSLRGPACLPNDADMEDAAQFLDLLEAEAESQAGGSDIYDLSLLEKGMDKLFAGNSTGPTGLRARAVQIMTIHKAKGLEFDTVIVPGLHRSPRQDDRKLLIWTELLNVAQGKSDFLLAPVRETGASAETDAIYRYIQQQKQLKQRQEDIRLMYVAATRAERHLHLLATVMVKDTATGIDDDYNLVPPRATSLLTAIWPAVLPMLTLKMRASPATNAEVAGASVLKKNARQNQPVRLVANLTMPEMPPAVSFFSDASHTILEPAVHSIEFDWASETARHVGTVVHAFLHAIAEDGREQWSFDRVASSRTRIERELVSQGAGFENLAAAVDRVVEALARALSDPRGNWILGSHQCARSEWRLTGVVDSVQKSIAIDRSFVDDAGVRWIIDYKTGVHTGSDIDMFLDNEQARYRQQLETYAVLLRGMQLAVDSPVIKLGLYFPLMAGWREWEWHPT